MQISVAMATYNGALYIEEQLESIYQSFLYWKKDLGEEEKKKAVVELILSDDGSTDGTKDVVENWCQSHSLTFWDGEKRMDDLRAKPRAGQHRSDCRLYFFPGPGQGVIPNFEHAMDCCTKDIIFLADQDDVWEETKVKRVLEEFQKDPKTTMVMHDAVVVDQTLEQVLMPSFFAYRGTKVGVFHNIKKNPYMGCCMAFKKKVAKRATPIPRNIPVHDQWIGLINDVHFTKCHLIQEPLLRYRRHGDNASDFGHNSIPVMIIKRLVLVGDLLKEML